MPITSIDLAVALSLLICGLVGLARGLIRQLVSIACCLVAVGCTVLLAPLLAPLLNQVIFTSSAKTIPSSLATANALVLLVTTPIAFILAARIVHAMLGRRITITDRSLGLLLGLARGFVLVVTQVVLFEWIVPMDKLPQSLRSALSYPLLHGWVAADELLQQPGSVIVIFWMAMGVAVGLSVLADLIAVSSRRWRLRRLDLKYAVAELH
jgi:membrane protein required for colicin V production